MSLIKNQMKKILASLVVMMFILTIMPFALAEDTVGNSNDNKVEDATSDANDINEEQDLPGITRDEADKNARRTINENAKNVREEAKTKVEELKKEIKNIREQYQEKKQEYQSQRDDIVEKKKEIKACNNDLLTDCKEKKSQLRGKVKDHLIKIIEMIDASVAQVKDHIKKSPQLTEEQKTQALVALEEATKDLETKKANLLAMQNATAAELNAAIKDLKQSWINIKQTEQWLLADLINSKMTAMVQKHDQYLTAIDAKIAALKAKNIDTTELESIKTDFNAALTTLKADQEALQTTWLEFKNSEDKTAAIKSVRDAQDKVKEDLNATKELLKEFTSKFRELNKSTESNKAQDNSTAEETPAPAEA